MDIDLDDKKLHQFETFKMMLWEWNKKMNLTAITKEEEIIDKHFIDSLTIIKTGYIRENIRLIDVGTGAGFPGIPLKIAVPDIKLVLIDALKKRTVFIKEVITQLKLDDIEVIHVRAEEIGQDKRYRERFDVCVSRAVASLDVLSEYCIPLVKLGGVFISQKGPNIENELNYDSKKAIEILGGSIKDIIQIYLPKTDIERKLITIDKIKQTPTKFPRKPAKVKKYPIAAEK